MDPRRAALVQRLSFTLLFFLTSCRQKNVIPADNSSHGTSYEGKAQKQHSFPHNVTRLTLTEAAQERHYSTFSHLGAKKKNDFAANIIHYQVIKKAKADHGVKQFSGALPQMPLSRFQHALY